MNYARAVRRDFLFIQQWQMLNANLLKIENCKLKIEAAGGGD
jgi:hypothetical protein